jgi:cyclase
MPTSLVCKAALAACLACAVSPYAVGAQARMTSPATDTYERVAAADRVYAFISPETYGQFVTGNTTVVVGDSAALVVDAGHFPQLTRRMIAEIKTLTNKPVRYLVITHFHPDHWMGSAEYRKAFPGVTIVSTTYTRDRILERGPGFIASERDSASMFARINGLLDSGLKGPGDTLRPPERLLLAATVPTALAAIAGWREARLEPPTLTVDSGSLRIQLGGREVHVIAVGRGNTGGDAMVYVPDAGVLATGDLVVTPVPYAYGTFFTEWIRALNAIVAMNPRVVVPGHGAVAHGTAEVRRLAEAATSLQSQVAEGVRNGSAFATIRKNVDVSKYAMLMAGSRLDRQASFELDFLLPGLARAYREALYAAEK